MAMYSCIQALAIQQPSTAAQHPWEPTTSNQHANELATSGKNKIWEISGLIKLPKRTLNYFIGEQASLILTGFTSEHIFAKWQGKERWTGPWAQFA